MIENNADIDINLHCIQEPVIDKYIRIIGISISMILVGTVRGWIEVKCAKKKKDKMTTEMRNDSLQVVLIRSNEITNKN